MINHFFGKLLEASHRNLNYFSYPYISNDKTNKKFPHDPHNKSTHTIKHNWFSFRRVAIFKKKENITGFKTSLKTISEREREHEVNELDVLDMRFCHKMLHYKSVNDIQKVFNRNAFSFDLFLISYIILLKRNL